MEMADLEIEMDKELISQTKNLAIRYFGDDSDVSMARVIEVAFRMRCLFSRSFISGQEETDEAVSQWQFPESSVNVEDNDKIRRWLFRR
jgi:hypothetical protein